MLFPQMSSLMALINLIFYSLIIFDFTRQKMSNLAKKRKDKNLYEKQAMDDLKEVKNYMSEGKMLLQKATNPHEIEEALGTFNKAIMKIAGSPQMPHINQLYHMRGLCYFKLKQYELAEKDFQQAILISDDKSKIIFYNSLGKCKMAMAQKDPNMLEEAIKCFEKVLEFSNRTDGQAFFNLGLVYRRMKNSPAIKAIKQFTDALKFLKFSQQFQAYIERGICYRQIQQLQNSIDDFTKACQIKKDDPYPHFNLGINYLLCYNYESALEKLSTAIELNKYEPQFYNYKALALYMTGQYDQSLIVFSEALKIYEAKNVKDAEVGQCWYNRGNALLNLSREEEALMSFRKTEEYEVDEKMQIKLLYAQGRAYESRNDITAIGKFKQCLSLINENKSNELYLSALYHLALNQQFCKQYTNSIDSLTKILQSDCNDKCVYEERGKAYLNNENYDLALRDFQIVASFDENYADIYYYKGKAKTNLGEIQSAIKDFFKAIELGSRKNGVFNGISEAYLRGSKFQKALIYSNISLEKQPKNEEFLIQRSRIYLELNEYQKGINDLSNALSVNERNPLVYYRRGLAYYKNKEYLAAIKDLQKSLKFDPSRNIQSDIYYHIGIAYSNLGKEQNALEPLSKAISLDPQPKYYHERAKCQILLDQNINALKDLNQVIKMQPVNAFAYFRRGFAHKALKLYDEAAEDFMKARELSPDDPRLIINKKQIYQTKYRKLCEAGEQL